MRINQFKNLLNKIVMFFNSQNNYYEVNNLDNLYKRMGYKNKEDMLNINNNISKYFNSLNNYSRNVLKKLKD